MLLYNASGVASEIIVTSIIDGKATSSLVTAPTINDSLLSSASNAIINNATTVGSSSAAAYGLGYATNQNPTNTGYTYKSSLPSTRRLSTQSGSMAFALQYPTNTNRSRGTNYHIVVDGQYRLNPATPSFSNPNSGSANQEFEKRYPTDKTGWTSVGGVLTSPKNR